MFYCALFEYGADSASMEVDDKRNDELKVVSNASVLHDLMERFYRRYDIIDRFVLRCEGLTNNVSNGFPEGFQEFMEYLNVLKEDCIKSNIENVQLMIQLDELENWLRFGNMPFSNDRGKFWRWCYGNDPEKTVRFLQFLKNILRDTDADISRANGNVKKRKME